MAFAAVFGLVLFQMHRVGGVVWFVANHTSAAWLLLPFLVGAMHPDLRRAVAYGMAAPLVALVAFYAFSPWWGLNLISERYYLQWLIGGLLTGPVCGALGHWWRARGSRAAGVAIAAVFVLEPFAWVAARGYLRGPLWVWCLEVALGLAVAILALCLRRGGTRAVA